MSKVDPLKSLKEHCAALNHEVLLALQILEIYRPSATGKKILSAFDQTYEAWSFNALRDSLHRDLVMTLSRIWDEDAADDVLSLPKAMKRLQGRQVQRKICKQAGHTRIQRRASAHLIVSTKGKTAAEIKASEDEMRRFLNSQNEKLRQEAEEKIHKEINELLSDYKRISKKQLLASLKRHRHKRLAHIALGWNEVNPTAVRSLKWGDERKIFHITAPLIERLCRLVQEIDHNYKDFMRVNRFYSRSFWIRVYKGPASDRGRRRRRKKPS